VDSALRIRNGAPDGLRSLAVRAGDVAGALPPYQRAVELQPARPDYSRNYAIVLSDTRRYDEAIAEARRALGLTQDQQAVADAQQLIQLIEAARQ